MVLKEVPKSAAEPFLFDTKGKLTVAGNSKEISLPVKMKADGKRLEFSAEMAAKMTDFGVEPVSALGGTIKTGDDITLGLSWVVQGK
jgi:polyisoprenoid-binding protein YceI